MKNQELVTEEALAWARSAALRFSTRYRLLDYDDALSDAFYAVVLAARAFDPTKGASFRTYACRRIDGAIIDGIRNRTHYQSKSFAPVSLSDPHDLGSLPAPENPIESLLDRLTLVSAMKSLNARECKTVFGLFFQGYEPSDIARMEKVTSGAICHRRFRALGTLRACLA